MRLALLALLVAAPAFAEPTVETTFTVITQPEGKPPVIEATLVGAPKTTPDKITLNAVTKAGKVAVKADKVRSFAEGKETIAIAIVVDGAEVWMGNDDLPSTGDSSGSGSGVEAGKYPGALKVLGPALDKLDLGANSPAGSQGMLITYGKGTATKVPMGDLKRVNGGALGTQKDYAGQGSSDMVQGITLAMAELSKVATARKALIVIGDGEDTNSVTAKPALADLKRLAATQNVETYAILFTSTIAGEGGISLTAMIPSARTVQSAEGIPTELAAITAKIADRYYVTFDGATLPWDGRDHELSIKIDTLELDGADTTMTPRWEPKQPWHFPWLGSFLGLLTIGSLTGAVIWVRKKRAGSPLVPVLPTPGQGYYAPVMQPVAPPEPKVQLKTSMMSAQANDDGFPIVGWLVPMNGSNQYRTMKLKPGLTKIGTGGASDIVVDDGFMSTEHCQITSSPQGFELRDAGSTNGCYVNEKKVAKEDLFDNDEIMLGKTKFKFKSIN
ncbi:MAG: FHA domain-containing protein [Kofleriaceae bacterium]